MAQHLKDSLLIQLYNLIVIVFYQHNTVYLSLSLRSSNFDLVSWRRVIRDDLKTLSVFGCDRWPALIEKVVDEGVRRDRLSSSSTITLIT